MKRFLTTVLLLLLITHVFAQKVALVYVYPSDANTANLWTKSALDAHFNGPIKRFWAEQSYGKYNPNVDVFVWKMPIVSADANAKNGHYVIDMINKMLPGNKNMTILGYTPSSYNQNIFLLGGGLIGFGGGYGSSDIKVNGTSYPKTSLGSFTYLHKNDKYFIPNLRFQYYGEGVPYTGKYNGKSTGYAELGLNDEDGTLLHEWGHGIGLSTHANYWRSDQEPLYGRIHWWRKKSFWDQMDDYGNYFDIMGSRKYSLHINAFYKDLMGWFDQNEKIMLNDSREKVTIHPLESQQKGVAKTAIYKIPAGEFSRPEPFNNKMDYAFYVEYRQAMGFDKHLEHPYLNSNTKGLMICMTRRQGDGFINSWLLDMSPENVVYKKAPADIATNDYIDEDDHHETTLNAGKAFYDDEIAVCFTNVVPNGNNGISFEFQKGKKQGVKSGVYTTALFSSESAAGKNTPLLYSANLSYYAVFQSNGNLVIKSTATNRLHSRDLGTGMATGANEMSLEDGKIIFKSNGKEVWASNISGRPKARLVINEEGVLQVIDGNQVIWPNNKKLTKPAVTNQNKYTRPLYDKMIAGNRLEKGQELVSADGTVVLRMQYDGNLAMYKNGTYIWDAKTAGKGHYLTLQSDGNLVVYDQSNAAHWSSKTHPYFNKKYLIRSKKPVELNLLSNGTFILINTTGQTMWTAPDNGANTTPVSNTETYTRPLYDKMIAGNRLEKGQELASADKTVLLRMQYDGNLAMYKNGKYIWDAKTVGKGHYLILQSDGNLVIYNQSNAAQWSSKTHPYFNKKYTNPSMKPVELNLLNNATFVLINSRGKTVWMAPDNGINDTPVSNTEKYTRPLYDKMIAGNRLEKGQELASADGKVVLRMQSDGNLAMYKNGKYIWDAKTSGKGHYLILQSDGNLVVYDQKNAAQWSSKTHPYFNKKYLIGSKKPVELNLLNNGTFILINTTGQTMWTAPQDDK